MRKKHKKKKKQKNKTKQTNENKTKQKQRKKNTRATKALMKRWALNDFVLGLIYVFASWYVKLL